MLCSAFSSIVPESKHVPTTVMADSAKKKKVRRSHFFDIDFEECWMCPLLLFTAHSLHRSP
jgi:hypothetical protein